MKPKLTHLLIVAAYLLAILLFASSDPDAAVLFATLAPAAAVFLVVARKQRHLALGLFAIFFFITNGLSPAFFFLQRDIYAYSGWGAVGDFDFNVAAYLRIAVIPFEIMAAITVVCALTTKAALSIAPVPRPSHGPLRVPQVFRSMSTQSRSASLLLALFVVVVAIPLSLFMLSKGIGIVGVENRTRLPFRLSGILYYTRYFLVPLVLFYLYARSTRPMFLTPVVLTYAAVAGLTSVSRSLLILSAISLPAYAFLDRKYLRLTISVATILMLYAIVTAARVFVYTFEAPDFSALLTASQMPMLETIGGITSRLGGAQDTVLAFQHGFSNPIAGVVNFFMGRPLMENYALELYGFNLPEGMAFGIGLTLFPSLVMIVGQSQLVLLLVGAAIGFVLVLFEKLVRAYLTAGPTPFVLTAYPLAFLLVFSLFGANFKALYFFLVVAILAIVGYRVLGLVRAHVAGASAALSQT